MKKFLVVSLLVSGTALYCASTPATRAAGQFPVVEQRLQAAVTAGNQKMVARIASRLGRMYLHAGDKAQAVTYLNQAVATGQLDRMEQRQVERLLERAQA